MMSAVTFFLAITSVALNAIAQVFLKKASTIFPAGIEPLAFIELFASKWLWLAMASYGLSIFTWIAVLQKTPLSTAYPMLSFGYILALISGFYLFDEIISFRKVIAVLLILVALWLLGTET